VAEPRVDSCMPSQPAIIDRLLLALAATLAVYLLVVLFIYGFYDGYLDHGEAIVTAEAFSVLKGMQVYTPFDGPRFTSNVYGPVLFLANGLMMAVFGGSVAASKLAGLLSAVCSVLLVVWAMRAGPRRWCLYAAIAMTSYILVFVPYSIWNRPDPLLLVLSCAGLVVIRSQMTVQRPVLGWIMIGILGGLACGLKIYGPLFLMPFGVYLALRHKSLVSVLVMSVAGLSVAFLPFVLQVFPLDNYLSWFGIFAKKPTIGAMAGKALRYGMFYLIPPIALIVHQFNIRKSLLKTFQDPDFGYTLSAIIGISGCIYLASKPGAGMYYVLPFAPIAIDMMVRLGTDENSSRLYTKRISQVLWLVIVAAMLVASVPIQKRNFKALEWDRTSAIKADLHTIMRKYNDKKIQMGVGNTIGGYHNTLQKTELILAGNPYSVDFGIMMETSFLKIPLPKALIETISSCQTDIWLIPRHEAPFEIIGYYGNKVVDDSFINAFKGAYALTGSSEYFDIWACKSR